MASGVGVVRPFASVPCAARRFASRKADAGAPVPASASSSSLPSYSMPRSTPSLDVSLLLVFFMAGMISSRAGYVKAGYNMSFRSKKKMPMVFSTQEAIDYMGVGRGTFFKYRDLLGIIPRKMYGVRGRFYLIHEIIEMMELRLPNVKQYRAHVLDRLEVLKQKGREQP